MNSLFRILILVFLSMAAVHAAEGFPTRTIVVVAPGAAGSTTDLFTRVLSEGLARELSRPVIVDNRPGAGLNIGNQMVAKAKPDGHTLLVSALALAINPHLYKNLAYDPIRDLQAVRLIARLANVVVVNGCVLLMREWIEQEFEVEVNELNSRLAPSKLLPGAIGHYSASATKNIARR